MSPIQIPIDAITSRFGDRFNSLRSQSLGTRFANLRPISEFLDFKRVSKPANFGEAQSRVNYNLSYFSSNYAAIFVMLSIYSLLTNPLLLFVIILVTGGLWGIGKLEGRDLELGFARFNTSQLYTGLLLVAVPLGFWASPISTALWLIGATGVTDGLRRSMMGHERYDNALGQADGADYDIYEDSDSTVAYAVELAMKDNQEWMVEKALERIRRAHSEGHKNVTLSKRELEALERKRLQANPGPGPLADSRALNGASDGASWQSGTGAAPPPPYPLDTSIHGAWARTTSASVKPQTSTTSLGSPLQPPFASSVYRPPAFFIPPALSRPLADDHQFTASQPTSLARDSKQPLRKPIDPLRGSPTRARKMPYMSVPSQAFVASDPGAAAPEPVVKKDNDSDHSSLQNRTSASSGDEISMVEVIEHKVPSSPPRVTGRGSRQRSHRP
ncbi:PRA1 family protein-domain-containing protein [Aspergillus karnatakaensis]|uniref:PRA1 family protein-domain-containing protein n=1 Tax=Aspergillus karnatakaensis TaxID=1810916 RepID=UPI003CCD0FFD